LSTPPPPPSSAATVDLKAAQPSSPSWPPSLSDETSPSTPTGLAFFQARKTNIVNFVHELHASWKPRFPGSDILSWRDKGDKEEVNIYIVGRLGKADLLRPRSNYNDPSYRLELLLEPESLSALRNLLENGPLAGTDDVNYPLLGRTAIFSAKLKTLQKNDASNLNLDVDDPFPFIYDGRDMPHTDLIDFPIRLLSDFSKLVIETHISTYAIPARGLSSGRTGYSMSLRVVYVIPGSGPDSASPRESSLTSRKRQGDGLVSPRKNKKAGQPAFFSDED
jgi:hypothetical protein